MSKIDILETLKIRDNGISIRIGVGSKYWHKTKKKVILIITGILLALLGIYLLISLILHGIFVADMFSAFRLTYINMILFINALFIASMSFIYIKEILVREAFKHLYFEIENSVELKNIFKSNELKITLYIMTHTSFLTIILLYFRALTLRVSFLDYLIYIGDHIIGVLMLFFMMFYLTAINYQVFQLIWGVVFDIIYGSSISVDIDTYDGNGKYVAKISNSVVEKNFHLEGPSNYPYLYALTIIQKNTIFRLYLVLKDYNKYKYLFLLHASIADLKRLLTEIKKSINIKFKQIRINKEIEEKDLMLEEKED